MAVASELMPSFLEERREAYGNHKRDVRLKKYLLEMREAVPSSGRDEMLRWSCLHLDPYRYLLHQQSCLLVFPSDL